MRDTTWIIKRCGPEDWLECEPGWYWGGVPNFDPDDPTLGDTVGPFPTAADAALDMVRTWAIASAAQPRSN